MAGSLHCSRASVALLDALEGEFARDATVLTPNTRAARDLRGQFAARKRAEDVQAWTPPRVLGWGAWLGSVWSALVTEGAETRLLLNAMQEREVWREVVSEVRTPGMVALDSAESLVDLAVQAWRLAAEFGVEGELRRTASTHDARTFAAWAAGFERVCEARGYVTAAELPRMLRMHVEAGRVAGTGRLVLLGWEKQTPAQRDLLAALRERGGEVVEVPAAVEALPGNRRMVVMAGSPEEEREAAARWVREFVAEGARRGEARRVAMVVPGVADERGEMEAVLRRVLAPELEDVGADASSAPWVFSAGVPLGETAVAGVALDLLRWMDGPLARERVSGLLLSPYVGQTEELGERAAFDAFVLRQAAMLKPEVSVGRLRKMARGAVRELCRRLEDVAEKRVRRGFAEWMEFARGVLREAGWPGNRALTGAEFAAIQAWEHALDAVSTLDFNGVNVELKTAFRALERQCAEAAVHVGQDAPVQVMGVGEAAGSAFDAVVVLHATDENWPGAERANPLLGWGLQREHDMPGVDKAKEAERGAARTAALVGSAVEVLFFCAREDEFGALRLAAAVEALGWEVREAAEVAGNSEARERVPEVLVEDAVALPSLASPEVRGGANVLRLQAQCPFRAFAEIRLGATELEGETLGMDARLNGTFLHGAMERFWRWFEEQEKLRRASEAERDARAMEAIAAALPRRVEAEDAWDEAYLQVQKDRLRALMRRWMQMELARGPFRVLEHEKASQVEVGPLRLDVRLDRMDEVDGGLVLVDYKTGYSTKPADWEGARPEEPQLPLYALLAEKDRLRGVAFAKVRAGDGMQWLGHADAAGVLPKPAPMVAATMEDQVALWRGVLTELATEFAAGRTAVDPKMYPVTCNHCGQRMLCRLDRNALLELEDEESEELHAD